MQIEKLQNLKGLVAMHMKAIDERGQKRVNKFHLLFEWPLVTLITNQQCCTVL